MRERRWGRAEEQAERQAYPRQHRPRPALGLINQLVPPFGQIQGSGIVGVILASASCPHPCHTRMAQCPEPSAPSRSRPTGAEEREHPLSRAPRACSHSRLAGDRSPSLHPHFVPWVGHQHSTKLTLTSSSGYRDALTPGQRPGASMSELGDGQAWGCFPGDSR